MGERIANEVCPITQERICHKVCTYCCQNSFEAANLIPWILRESTCPMCRCLITTNDLILKHELPRSPSQFLYNSMCSKEVTFKKDVLSRYSSEKILIFANNEIGVVRSYLEDLKICFTEFSGRIINKTLYNFNER